MVAQVLILRELLVLAQGQELKLALGLWCWLLWVGLGSLAGGRFTPAGAGPGRLGGLLALLGLLLPATILAGRALPTLAHLPLGQSLPLSTTFLPLFCPAGSLWLSLRLLFPHCGPGPHGLGQKPPRGHRPGLLSGDPGRGPGGGALATPVHRPLCQPDSRPGRGVSPGPGALAPGPAPVNGGPHRHHRQPSGPGRGPGLRAPVGIGQPRLAMARPPGHRHRGQPLCPLIRQPGSRADQLFCQ